MSEKIQTRDDFGQFGPSHTREKLDALEVRRQAIREAHAAAYEEQLLADMTALVDLEEEHGFERTVRVDLGSWKSGVGAATMVVARIPGRGSDMFKRYEQSIARAKSGTTDMLNAAHQLAESCLVYPSKKAAPELYEATMELAPGVLTNLALQVSKAVQGHAEEEKKG